MTGFSPEVRVILTALKKYGMVLADNGSPWFISGAPHPDFGTEWQGAPIGIPWTSVPGSQPAVPITFLYSDESDPGPYPIPPDAPIEGGPASDGDRHVLVVDRDACILYEMFYAFPENAGSSWSAGSGAVFDLGSNDLRPSGWTSADAAGLPVLPGLVRYEEVMSGEIRHALRFTAPETRKSFVWPARHFASNTAGRLRYDRFLSGGPGHTHCAEEIRYGPG
jgi:hypothetical protein